MTTRSFNVIRENNLNHIICKEKEIPYSVFRSRCAVPIKYTPDLRGKYLTLKLKDYRSPICLKIKNYVNSNIILKGIITKEFGLPLLDTSLDSFDILGSGSITVLPCSAGNLLNIVRTYTSNNNFKYIGATKNGFFKDEISDKSDLYYIKDDLSNSSILSPTFKKEMVIIYGNFETNDSISYSIESISKDKINNPFKMKYQTNKNGDFNFRAIPLSETKITLENGKTRKLVIPGDSSFLNFDQLKSYNMLTDWEM